MIGRKDKEKKLCFLLGRKHTDVLHTEGTALADTVCYAFLITIQLKHGKAVCVINTILLFHLVRNLLKFLTVSNIPKRDTEQKSAHTFTAICQIQKL